HSRAQKATEDANNSAIPLSLAGRSNPFRVPDSILGFGGFGELRFGGFADGGNLHQVALFDLYSGTGIADPGQRPSRDIQSHSHGLRVPDGPPLDRVSQQLVIGEYPVLGVDEGRGSHQAL